MNLYVRSVFISVFSTMFFCGIVVAQEVGNGCGALQNAFGPYDYRAEKFVPFSSFKSIEDLRKTVHDYHFTNETRMLMRRPRNPGTPVGDDLGYTLRVFPNHHEALITLIALGEKEKTDKPLGSIYSIDCWFRRAINFRPGDNVVRVIYSTYLAKAGREKEAEGQLDLAANQAGENPFTFHNIGLVYFDMKNYEKALHFAHKAYAHEWFGIPVLRDQLQKVGKWVEPADASGRSAEKVQR